MSKITFTRWSVSAFLAWGLAGGLCLAVTDSGGPVYANEASSASEEALRTRVQQLYTALQENDWTKVEGFLTDESKAIFQRQPKSGVKGFEIQSVKIEPGGQAASVVVEVPFFSPNAPGALPVEKATRWRLVNQVWYLELPKPDPHLLQSLYSAPPKRAFSRSPLAVSKDLKFESTWASIGYIHAGDVKLARFPFTNVSQHAVSLVEVQTGSECLQLKNQQKEFKPGERAVLEFQFDSSCMGAVTFPLGLTQAVLLKTEPGDAWVKLIISGRLVPGSANQPKP